MPISASAKKALRVSLRRGQENRSTKARVKHSIKKATLETLGHSYSLIDKAAKNHIIHPNKAARLKSRLAKKMAQPVEATVPAPVKVAKKTTTRKKTAKKT